MSDATVNRRMTLLTRLPSSSLLAGWLVGCGVARAAGGAAACPSTLPVATVQRHAARPERRARARSDRRLHRAGRAELRGGRSRARSGASGRGARALRSRRRSCCSALPGGAASEPRLAAEFERLLDRISALDRARAARGRRLHRGAYRAGGDRRAARTTPTFERAGAGADDRGNRRRGSRAHAARHADPGQRARCCRTSSCSRAGCTTSCRRASIAVGAYLPMIQEVFAAEGLPLDLAYVPLVESAFKTDGAVARERARHVAVHAGHRVRSTASQQNWFVDERSDPEKATRAAAQYLKTLAEDVRRRLEPRARQLQRRARPRCSARSGGRRRPTTGRSPSTHAATCRARRASTCR